MPHVLCLNYSQSGRWRQIGCWAACPGTQLVMLTSSAYWFGLIQSFSFFWLQLGQQLQVLKKLTSSVSVNLQKTYRSLTQIARTGPLTFLLVGSLGHHCFAISGISQTATLSNSTLNKEIVAARWWTGGEPMSKTPPDPLLRPPANLLLLRLQATAYHRAIGAQQCS